MSVSYRLVDNGGNTSSIIHSICWGRLKGMRFRVNSKMKNLTAYCRRAFNRENRARVRSGMTRRGYDEYVDQLLSETRVFLGGLDIETAVKLGIRYVDFYPSCGGSMIRNIRTMIEDWSVMFDGCSVIDDFVRVDCDKHYAIVYNQLRMLRNVTEIGARQHVPDKYLPVLAALNVSISGKKDFCFCYGDNQPINTQTFTLADMKTLLSTKDFILTDKQRNDKRNNMMYRWGCHKRVGGTYQILQRRKKQKANGACDKFKIHPDLAKLCGDSHESYQQLRFRSLSTFIDNLQKLEDEL